MYIINSILEFLLTITALIVEVTAPDSYIRLFYVDLALGLVFILLRAVDLAADFLDAFSCFWEYIGF